VRLSSLLREEHIFLDLPAADREGVLALVSGYLEKAGVIRNAREVVELLLERERLGATVVGEQAAIPHCKVPGLKSVVAAFARTAQAIRFGNGESAGVRLFFFVLSPRDQPAAHLQVLASIARLLRNRRALDAFLLAESPSQLRQALVAVEGG
jgi:mannitol/fructose-specific phosphotransferase system IIA component (Ntr-type)